MHNGNNNAMESENTCTYRDKYLQQDITDHDIVIVITTCCHQQENWTMHRIC